MELKPVAFASIDSCLPDNGQAFQMEASAHMMQILSNRIYTDKIGAVVRELSCNANDSHIAARQNTGWKVRPFVVNVPTALDPVFYVEDFGTGIPHEKIADIYWSYGKSTKTQDNLQTGALGLGSKSPFAYTESFVVRNRYNGLEITYFCAPNAKGIPMGHEVGRCDTTESNGVRVELAVKAADVSAFRLSMIRFFRFWDEAKLPEFKNDSRIRQDILATIGKIILSGDDWFIRENSQSGAIALMGNVPYAIKAYDHVHACPELKAISKTNIVMNFKMGEVSFTPSREELEYDPDTLAVLNARAKIVTKAAMATISNNLNGVYEFPFQLFNELENRTHKLARSFSSIVDIFRNETFALNDGRKFSYTGLRDLQYKYVISTWAGRNDIVIFKLETQVVQRVNGLQRWKLTPETQLELNHNTTSSSNAVPWFPASTKPVLRVGTSTRARTIPNLLADGYFVANTKIELSKHKTKVVINDLGAEGEIAIKFFNSGISSTYFATGDYANKTPQETLEFVKSIYKNTFLEGQIQFTFLSKLSNFVLDKTVVAAVPRKAIERGTIPLDCQTCGYGLSGNVNVVRVDYTEPIYFVPSRAKLCTDLLSSEVLTLLNRVNNGKKVTVAYLTPTDEKTLAAKKATLIKVTDLVSEYDNMITPKFIEEYSKYGFYTSWFGRIISYRDRANKAGSTLFVEQVENLKKQIATFKTIYRVELQLCEAIQGSSKLASSMPNYAKFQEFKHVPFFTDFPNIDELFKTNDSSMLPIVMILACEKIKGFANPMFK